VQTNSNNGKSIEDLNNQFFKMIEELEPSANNGPEDEPIVRFPNPTFSPIKSYSIKNNYFETMLGRVQISRDIPRHAYTLSENKFDVLPELDIEKCYSYEFEKPNVADDVIYDINDLIEKKNPNTIEITIEKKEENKEQTKAMVVKKDWLDILFSDIDLFAPVDLLAPVNITFWR
jgi:hypothetical protein